MLVDAVKYILAYAAGARHSHKMWSTAESVARPNKSAKRRPHFADH